MFMKNRNMTKRKKFTPDEIEGEIVHFLTVTKASDEASDYLLSQSVYMVGEMTKKAQTEFLNGLINAKQEMR